MPGKERLDALRRELLKAKLDAHLVTSIINVRYLSGFTGSTGAVLVTPDQAVILVDSRYTLQASRECHLFEVRQFTGHIMAAAAALLNELGTGRSGFEESGLTYEQYLALRRKLEPGRRLIRSGGLVDLMRLVKDDEETSLIRRAVDISDGCFSDLLTWLAPGTQEREVALQLEVCMRRHGADKPAFDSIVAAGPNAAFPHHRAGETKLAPGQLVKLDFGAELQLYPSDITRTVVIGRSTSKQREVYRIVLDAQLAAIEAIRPGVAGREIDAVARSYITERGYGENFGHGLGHSLGMGVHDGPGLSKTSDVILEPGMVMTVEPGIYIEGWGGVRIEDDVLVTENGCEVLNKSPKKELIEIWQ